MTTEREASERVSFVEGVVLQTIGGEAILLKLDEETVFALNETGARVARAIAQGATVTAIVRGLAEDYSASIDQIEREVRDLLSVLQTRGLVVLRRVDSFE